MKQDVVCNLVQSMVTQQGRPTLKFFLNKSLCKIDMQCVCTHMGSRARILYRSIMWHFKQMDCLKAFVHFLRLFWVNA